MIEIGNDGLFYSVFEMSPKPFLCMRTSEPDTCSLRTDLDGRVALATNAPGVYVITAKFANYQTRTVEVEVVRGLNH